MSEPITALILAGGRSTRMGQDKAWLKLGAQPLVELAARRLLPVASEILFSTNEPERYQDLVARLPLPSRAVPDLLRGAGPLAGLHAGLRSAAHDLLFAVGTDMPFLNLDLVRYMATLSQGVQVVLPFVKLHAVEKPEPLHAFYRRSCLAAVEKALAEGRRRLASVFPDLLVHEVRAEVVAQFDPDFRSFFNVNTPEDYAQAMCKSQTRRK